MEQAGKHQNGNHNFSCCGPMMKHGRRSCSLGFGIMLVLVGTISLASEMGWVAPDLFWPVLLLAAGMALLILNLARGRRPSDGDKEKQGGVA